MQAPNVPGSFGAVDATLGECHRLVISKRVERDTLEKKRNGVRTTHSAEFVAERHKIHERRRQLASWACRLRGAQGGWRAPGHSWHLGSQRML